MMTPSAEHQRALRPPQPYSRTDVTGADGRLIDESDLRKLEELDDVIFSALDGDPEALNRSTILWRTLSREAPPALVEEAREQYVRRAAAIRDSYREAPRATLAQSFAALEILALLAE